MKIAFLSRYQGEIERGAEVFVKEVAKRLSKNHQVIIFSGKDADSLKTLANTGFDIVIPINGKTQSLKASLVRFIRGYKVVITGHSGIGRDDIWNILVVFPDAFVALTEHMRKWAQKWNWFGRVVKINNGVDLYEFMPKGRKVDFGLMGKIVLSVGALVWYKHHEKVIDAVSRLDGVSLVIVGEGREKDGLIKLANQKLEGRYLIKSFSYKEMPSVYRSADVFTLPSWDREAFGMVYLEAMACNIPVVAPFDDARKEIIGDGGVLVDVEDPITYSKALELALNKDWKEMPRKQAEKFSWESCVNKYEELFEKIVNE